MAILDLQWMRCYTIYVWHEIADILMLISWCVYNEHFLHILGQRSQNIYTGTYYNLMIFSRDLILFRRFKIFERLPWLMYENLPAVTLCHFPKFWNASPKSNLAKIGAYHGWLQWQQLIKAWWRTCVSKPSHYCFSSWNVASFVSSHYLNQCQFDHKEQSVKFESKYKKLFRENTFENVVCI